MKKVQDKIKKAISDVLVEKGIDVPVDKLATIPPDRKMGDFAIQCQSLSRILRLPPQTIAEDIASKVKHLDGSFGVARIEPVGGYINIYYDNSALTAHTLTEILSQKDNYGSNDTGLGQKIVLDFSSPNYGKSLHVGHIRSTVIGDSMSRIFEFNGYRTHRINYVGDIGLHIGKIIAAHEKWGGEYDFAGNSEKAMAGLYVRFCDAAKINPELDAVAKQILEDIQAGDRRYDAVLARIREGSSEVFDRIYIRLGVKFDETAGQSNFSERGTEIVLDAVKKGIARHCSMNEEGVIIDDGDVNAGVVIDLSSEKLPPKMVLASNNRAIYSTQDIGAAADRYEKHKFDKMFYVVANEQELYFQQLFATLKKTGFDWYTRCNHLGFGLIHLAEGKISSREGNMVLLEELLDKAVALSGKIIEERGFSDDEKQTISEQIGVSAVKYMILQVSPQKEMTFSWEKALDFNGNSAVYLQYTNARINNMLRNVTYAPELNADELQHDSETNLIRTLGQFPDIVRNAAEQTKPNLIANYVFGLCKEFNRYYSTVRIIGSEQEQSRIMLAQAAQQVITNACNLIGVALPEKM